MVFLLIVIHPVIMDQRYGIVLCVNLKLLCLHISIITSLQVFPNIMTIISEYIIIELNPTILLLYG